MRKCEDFNDPSCDEIFMGWYSPSIYEVYFDNIYIDDGTTSNNSNDNNILINKVEVECKENTKSNQQKKFVNLSYYIWLQVYYYYKDRYFQEITCWWKMFKVCNSLLWKPVEEKPFVNWCFLFKIKMNGLKLIFKIAMYLKWKIEKGLTSLDYPIFI
jgi:hypothetical protein